MGSAAIVLFLALFAITQFGATPSQSTATLDRLSHGALNVFHGMFFAGALPAAIAAYFWLYRQERMAFALGFGAVVSAILVHYLAVAAVAHGSTFVASAAILFECAVGWGTVAFAQYHFTAPPCQANSDA